MTKKILPVRLAKSSLGGGPEPKIEQIKKIKIRVIGIGDGGGTIVSEIAPRIEKATFFAANTHWRALKELSKKVKPFPFGQNLTKGLGTGMNPQLGEKAAESDQERIKNLFKDQDLVILIACLGGGTSSGATPIFAKIAKNLGCLIYGFFTLPFKFEGKKKMEIARNSLEKLRPELNTLSIIPNERIFQTIDKATPLREALSAINKALAENLEGLLEVIYQPGLINIDFADLKTILEGQGKLSYLNSVTVQKKAGIKTAIEKSLNSSLYPYSIEGAKGILFNIAGEKNLSLEEVSQISNAISQLASPEAKIIFGLSAQTKHSDQLKITIFATGCQTKIFEGKPKKKKKRAIPKAISAPSQETEKKAQQELEAKRERKIKLKKIKVEVPKPEKTVSSEKIEPEKSAPPALEIKSLPEVDQRVKVRKNALQIKKEVEEAEREIVEKEKFWEIPAFLRKNLKIE